MSALLVALLALSGDALADDHVNGGQAAQGGTIVAHPRMNASVTSSPGAIGLTDRYDVEILGIGGGPGWRWGASAVDTRTSKLIAFGIVYNGGITRPPFLNDELPGWQFTGDEIVNRKQKHEITAGLSFVLLKRRLGLGLNGTLAILDTNFQGDRITGNLDLGIAGRPIDYLSIGFAARDILPVADQVDTPATLAFGVRGGVEEMITASFDVEARLEHVVSSPWTLRGGVEGSIEEVVRLRAGWDWNADTGIHGVGVGIGLYSFKAGAIDYGVRIPVNQPDLVFVDAQHTLSLTIYTRFLADMEPDEDPLEWDGK